MTEHDATHRPLWAHLRVAAVAFLVTAVCALVPATGDALATPIGDQHAAAEAPAVTGTQSSLWAATINPSASIGACGSPASAQSLSSCFEAPTSYGAGTLTAMATDGTNVYFAGSTSGYGLSCPVSGLGTNCTKIAAGPWPSSNNQVNALAAADGYLYIGQDNGLIYRCPVNQPYDSQNPGAVPSQCVQLDNAGSRSVHSLAMANGTLYAGLANYGTEQKKQGLLWTCEPDTTNACSTLDTYGKTYANSMVAGGGYLWVGLNNSIILRCDPQAVNACDTWETAGSSISSVSYDGNDTLYAGTKFDGVLACPTAANCSTLIPNVRVGSVAAGPGGVFSSNGSASQPLRYGATSAYAKATLGYWGYASLLYLPPEGPLGVGGVAVKATGVNRLRQRCDGPGPRPVMRVRLTSPRHPALTRRTSLCSGSRVTTKAVYVPVNDLLDRGRYVVSARAVGLSAQAPVTVNKNRTATVRLRLSGGLG